MAARSENGSKYVDIFRTNLKNAPKERFTNSIPLKKLAVLQFDYYLTTSQKRHHFLMQSFDALQTPGDQIRTVKSQVDLIVNLKWWKFVRLFWFNVNIFSSFQAFVAIVTIYKSIPCQKKENQVLVKIHGNLSLFFTINWFQSLF